MCLCPILLAEDMSNPVHGRCTFGDQWVVQFVAIMPARSDENWLNLVAKPNMARLLIHLHLVRFHPMGRSQRVLVRGDINLKSKTLSSADCCDGRTYVPNQSVRFASGELGRCNGNICRVALHGGIERLRWTASTSTPRPHITAPPDGKG